MGQTLSLTQWCDKGPIEKDSECKVIGRLRAAAASKGGCKAEQTLQDNVTELSVCSGSVRLEERASMSEPPCSPIALL